MRGDCRPPLRRRDVFQLLDPAQRDPFKAVASRRAHPGAFVPSGRLAPQFGLVQGDGIGVAEKWRKASSSRDPPNARDEHRRPDHASGKGHAPQEILMK